MIDLLKKRMIDMYDRYRKKIKDKLHTYDRFIQKQNERYYVCMIYMKKIKDKLHTYDRFIQKKNERNDIYGKDKKISVMYYLKN